MEIFCKNILAMTKRLNQIIQISFCNERHFLTDERKSRCHKQQTQGPNDTSELSSKE